MKLSQETFAERAGLHPTYVGRVERGEKNVSFESMSRIAAALRLRASRLFAKAGL